MAKNNEAPEVDLKGTLVSVFMVGLVIIAMWLAVYVLYIGR
ncbi:cytochrome C oxidase subunit II [Planococcus shixiaomingii]|nr:cytochrome C oxidase subunit II [Planococcus sp. N022]WKA54618.1 cytochrome C oxidase subunit II [Planococcus sp. N022]